MRICKYRERPCASSPAAAVESRLALGQDRTGRKKKISERVQSQPGITPGPNDANDGPGSRDGPGPFRARRWLQLVAGLAVAALFLGLALDRVEPEEVLATLSRADPMLLGLALVVLLTAQVVRAAAWSLLAGGFRHLPLPVSLRLLLAGGLANLVLPMRGGELARVWLLARRGGIGAGRATAVVVVERTVDLFVLLAVVVAAGLVVALPEWVQRGAWRLALVGVLAAGALTALVLARRPVRALLERLGARGGAAGAVARFGAHIVAGVEGLRARSAGAAALAVVGSWALVLAGLELRLQAFGIEVPAGGSVAVLAAANVASSVPVVPAGLGLLEYATMLCLELMGVSPSEGLAFAAASHGLTIALVASAGGVALALDAVARRRVAAGASEGGGARPSLRRRGRRRGRRAARP